MQENLGATPGMVLGVSQWSGNHVVSEIKSSPPDANPVNILYSLSVFYLEEKNVKYGIFS